jgi:type II secretory pathway component PulF
MYLIPIYILVLFAVISIDYFAAIQIEKVQEKHKKKYLLLKFRMINRINKRKNINDQVFKFSFYSK